MSYNHKMLTHVTVCVIQPQNVNSYDTVCHTVTKC